MWDTVAWNYRMNRLVPEFSRRGVNVIVIDGVLQVNYKGKTTEFLDDDVTIGGVRIVVSRRGHMVFFIVGFMRRKKLSSYIAGVSSCNEYVTAQTVQAVVAWTQELAAVPPEDSDPNEGAIAQAIHTITRSPDGRTMPNPTEEVAYNITPEYTLRVDNNRGTGRVAPSTLEVAGIEWQSE